MSLILAVHHVSLLVSDVTRARQFYEQVLGLQVDMSRPNMRFDGVWYRLGAVQIHLLCVSNPDAEVVRPPYVGLDRHLALLVGDWDGLCLRLQQHAIPYTISQSGRRALFCRDLDGNGLECIAVTDDAL